MSATTAFVGWHREGRGPWNRVCEGPTFGECWKTLLGSLRAIGGKFGESVVLRADVNPNIRRK